MCGRACAHEYLSVFVCVCVCVCVLLACNELTPLWNQEGGGGFPNFPADGHLIPIAFYGWRGKKNIKYKLKYVKNIS